MTTDPITQARETVSGMTPGPWDVYVQDAPDKDEAINHLAEQVEQTSDFVGKLFLLTARGKCPATTGCGPTSEANAAGIILATNLLRTLTSEGAEEALARVIAPDAFDIDSPVHDDTAARFHGRDTGRGLARAIISHLLAQAIGER